jgi:hypothetical protein
LKIVPSDPTARRTFLVDSLRALPSGCLETLGLTYAVLIAVRVFDADKWAKASLVAAPGLGLLLSLFVVQFVRRTGWSVNRVAAGISLLAAAGLVGAALGGRSEQVYLTSMWITLTSVTLAVPLMSQIYRKHYPDRSRGRLFALTGVVRKLAALSAAAGFGWIHSLDLDHFRWLLAIYALACVAMAVCVLWMESVHLSKANRVRLFSAFAHVRRDRPFRKLLISWMILGFGNLLCFALFVEYISNPVYGYEFDVFTIGMVTGVVPEVMFLFFVVGWGIVFDRVNFFLVRMLINILFIFGILFYFMGDGLWALCIGIGFHGLARSGGNVAWSLWVTKFARGEHVAEYMSVHTFLTGARSVVAPFVAFPLALHLGPSVVGAVGATLIFIATLMILPDVHWRRALREGIPVEPDPRTQ